jgi:hypothetical protein
MVESDSSAASYQDGDRDLNSLGGTDVAIYHNVGDGEGLVQVFEAVPLFCRR